MIGELERRIREIGEKIEKGMGRDLWQREVQTLVNEMDEAAPDPDDWEYTDCVGDDDAYMFLVGHYKEDWAEWYKRYFGEETED